MKNDNTNTTNGIIEKLVIATKELSTVKALIHRAFDIKRTKNHIKNIQIKFCFTTSKSGIQLNE
jgi:hypothetical protein